MKVLSEKALTVRLKISRWTARKYDERASKEVSENHEAEDAGRFNKILIAQKHLKKINQAVTKLKTFHDFNTFPWDDNGTRLLPAANYLDYMRDLRVLISDFNVAVKEFITNYDHYVQDARNTLGDLFDENDYPTKEDVERKFGIEYIPLPVPDTDFRVELDDEDVQAVKSAVEIEVQKRMNNAMQESWIRIKEVLTAMKEKLSDKDAIFRKSLFENVEDLVNLLPKMNMGNDAKLNEIVEEMRGLVVDPDTVRSDQTLRSVKAQEVESIMDKFKDFF